MSSRAVILPPPPEADPPSRPCMPPPAECDEPAESERLTEPGGYSPDLDVAARLADCGAWYEREVGGAC